VILRSPGSVKSHRLPIISPLVGPYVYPILPQRRLYPREDRIPAAVDADDDPAKSLGNRKRLLGVSVQKDDWSFKVEIGRELKIFAGGGVAMRSGRDPLPAAGRINLTAWLTSDVKPAGIGDADSPNRWSDYLAANSNRLQPAPRAASRQYLCT
jgi:hypothetical protein